MSKKTTLGDDAIIYQHKDNRTEREKLKDMNSKEKLSYIIEYYKLHITAVIISIIVIVSIISSILNPDPTLVLYMAVVNIYLDDETKTSYSMELGEFLDIDFESEEVFIDTSMVIEIGSSNIMSVNNQQRLTTYIYAGQIDLLLTDIDTFKNYASFGYFCDLSEVLPSELYNKLSDKIVFCKKEDSDETYAYGFEYTLDNHEETYVMGILINADNKENAINSVQFLYDNYIK